MRTCISIETFCLVHWFWVKVLKSRFSECRPVDSKMERGTLLDRLMVSVVMFYSRRWYRSWKWDSWNWESMGQQVPLVWGEICRKGWVFTLMGASRREVGSVDGWQCVFCKEVRGEIWNHGRYVVRNWADYLARRNFVRKVRWDKNWT